MRATPSRSPRALFFIVAALVTLSVALLGCPESFSTAPADDEDAASDATNDSPGISTADGAKPDAADAAADVAKDSTTDAPGDVVADVHPDARDGQTPEASADGSVCAPPDLACTAGCVPSDIHNCGTCGNDCATLPHVTGPVSCTPAGACSFPTSSCAPGWGECNGNPLDGCETDLSQPASCGTCTNACPTSMPVCSDSGGSYACVTGCTPPASTLCGGTCVDTTSNASHCGTCTNACAGAADGQPACASSVCGVSCETDYTACPTIAPTACVDEQNDTGNCGGCGNMCHAPTSGSGQVWCSGGECGITCNAGLTGCPVLDPTACVVLASDVNNCGSCGVSCPGGTCSGGTCAITFGYTGAEQSLVISPGVSTVTVTAAGAAGGASGSVLGGEGGSVTATITVTPGETLAIFVGEAGGPAEYSPDGGAGLPPFNGGGLGGDCTGPAPPGNGGGASDVRQAGSSLASRVIVTGGGGGAGYGDSPPYGGGGSGGNTTGGNGTDGASGADTGGLGGTSTGGGKGCGGSCPGTSGIGGNGESSLYCGGGGGGGYFGGAGGSMANSSPPGAGGGGGGSSYVIPTATGVTMQQGVQTGNGQIVITY